MNDIIYNGFIFSEEKNTKIKKDRGFTFQELIEGGTIIDVIEHTKPEYIGQKFLIIQYQDQLWKIPFRITKYKLFEIATAFPCSREKNTILNILISNSLSMSLPTYDLDNKAMIDSLDENHRRADDADEILNVLESMRQEYARPPEEFVRTSILLYRKDYNKLRALASDMHVPYQVFTREFLSRTIDRV